MYLKRNRLGIFKITGINVQLITRVKNGHFEHVLLVLVILRQNGYISALGDDLKLLTGDRVLDLALVINVIVAQPGAQGQHQLAPLGHGGAVGRAALLVNVPPPRVLARLGCIVILGVFGGGDEE